jgi:hypothetical protein
MATRTRIPKETFESATGGGSGDGAETIDGSTTQAIATTTSLRVMSDGANWIIV